MTKIQQLQLSQYINNMSRLKGKPTICKGENKDADQLRGNHIVGFPTRRLIYCGMTGQNKRIKEQEFCSKFSEVRDERNSLQIYLDCLLLHL